MWKSWWAIAREPPPREIRGSTADGRCRIRKIAGCVTMERGGTGHHESCSLCWEKRRGVAVLGIAGSKMWTHRRRNLSPGKVRVTCREPHSLKRSTALTVFFLCRPQQVFDRPHPSVAKWTLLSHRISIHHDDRRGDGSMDKGSGSVQDTSALHDREPPSVIRSTL